MLTAASVTHWLQTWTLRPDGFRLLLPGCRITHDPLWGVVQHRYCAEASPISDARPSYPGACQSGLGFGARQRSGALAFAGRALHERLTSTRHECCAISSRDRKHLGCRNAWRE